MTLQERLLEKCIADYIKTYEAGRQDNCEKYGSPPESILIAIGPAQVSKTQKPLLKIDAVYRYSAQNLTSVPSDTVPNLTENRMYYKEAYAELSYYGNSVAFIMVCYGKRYAACWRYNILNQDGDIQLTNEKFLWMS